MVKCNDTGGLDDLLPNPSPEAPTPAGEQATDDA